jgi:hypothetical protein
MDQSQTEQAAATVAAIHGDGSNRSEPGDTSRESSQEASTGAANGLAGTAPTSLAEGAVALETTKDRQPVRRRLADERKAIVHHFSVGGHEGYLMVGLYEDGQPGEIFIRMAKAGSTIAGLMDSFGIAISMALQYGVPLKWQACHFRDNPKDEVMRRMIVGPLFLRSRDRPYLRIIQGSLESIEPGQQVGIALPARWFAKR